jgi:hypothetical protein
MKPFPVAIAARRGWVRRGLLAVLALLLVGGGAWLVYRWQRDRAFRPHLAEYLNPGEPRGKPERWGVSGKMVVVDDAKGGSISDLHHGLPREWRADRPEDVRAVVVLHWRALTIPFKRVDGKPYDVEGTQWFCDVRVYDWPSRTLLTTREIAGEAPPQEITRPNDADRPKPTREVLDYLTKLPAADLPRGPAAAPQK